jgi:hypothetical protein
LKKEEFDRISRPGNLQPLAQQLSILDFAAFVIGHELAIFVIAAKGRLAIGLNRRVAKTRMDQIARDAIDRHVKAGQVVRLPEISGS